MKRGRGRRGKGGEGKGGERGNGGMGVDPTKFGGKSTPMRSCVSGCREPDIRVIVFELSQLTNSNSQTTYEGRSKSFEPNLCTEEID